MEDDTTDAQWHQQELDERRRREDELIETLRKDAAGFRGECDDFTAAFQNWNRNLNHERQ